jgi:hypothetical protein
MGTTERQFVVVMRGPSGVLFLQGKNLIVLNHPSAIGPVEI